MQRLFISYTRNDQTWAEWIAWIIEEEGHKAVIQAWDFRPGGNFVLEMQEATSTADRIVLVLSEAFLESAFTKPEWAAAFADDPTGEHRKLLPIRIAPCKPEGLLKAIIYADLVGLDEQTAREVVVMAMQARAKPKVKPSFPGVGKGFLGKPLSRGGTAKPAFPGLPSLPGAGPDLGRARSIWREKLAFLEEHAALAVDPAHKFALAKQIEEAKGKIRTLGN